MTVYVDEILDWTLIAQARGLRHTHWCHLTADTEQELHAFAARLGLRRSWYQRKGPDDVAWHYDVTPNKRAQAVRLGAQEVDHGFIARLMDHRRRERDGVPGGMVCGNDPRVELTDGDRQAIENFRAFLAQRGAPPAMSGPRAAGDGQDGAPACEGFVWIGQPFTTCDRCGQPAWEHEGEEVAVDGAGPFDTRRTVRPWKPGQADAIRAKWDPQYVGEARQDGAQT